MTAALAVTRALECSVEELFGGGARLLQSSGPEWAWQPRAEPCRFWEAEVVGRRWLYPVESLALNATAHDGVWRGGAEHEVEADVAEQTLVLACCDPAAGLLAAEYARSSGFRLLVLPRGGTAALELLKRGLIHAAGLHRSTEEHSNLNVETVRSRMGGGYRLLRAARWEEGVALPTEDRTRSADRLPRQSHRWALREPGSAARECLDELNGVIRSVGRALICGAVLTALNRHAADAKAPASWRFSKATGLPDWLDIGGDDSPTDGESNRFDTLYGARRFEHGPTGIYGAFARANIPSPGPRLVTKPAKPLEVMMTYRPYWLASDTDAWTISGMRDASGNSGSFVGHQLEARVRWDVLPGNVRLEAGSAYLFAGEFSKNAPNATFRGDTAYGYLSLELTF